MHVICLIDVSLVGAEAKGWRGGETGQGQRPNGGGTGGPYGQLIWGNYVYELFWTKWIRFLFS